MPKTKISEYSTTNSSNTDIEGINIDEGCPPSSINNAIRELMVHLKEFQTGASGDAFTFAGGTLMSGTNTISGAAVISGNINSSGTTNTFSGGNIFSGTNTFSGTNVFSSDVTLNAQKDLRFADSDSSNWVAFQAPATVASNVTWTLPAADGTANQALVTNGSGTLSFATSSSLTGVTDSASPFETALGTGAGGSNTGVNNTFVGYNAGNAFTTGTNSVAVGYNCLDANTTGIINTAVGALALTANTTGSYNTAMGFAALEANTTASNNTGIGYAALGANTTGANNTAVGYGALDANQTGVDNTAVGYNALGANTTNYNNAFGYEAMFSTTTGTRNNAMGRQALYTNTTGNDNVALGHAAMRQNTTGSSNTAVGYEALYANTTGVNNTAIGLRALEANTTGENNTVLGYAAGVAITTGSKNICIGRVAGDGNVSLTTGSSNICIGDRVTPNSSSGTHQIVISGVEFAAGKGNDTAFINANGGASYNGGNTTTWTTTSDRRIKKNIVDNNEGLEKINGIRVRNFEYRLPEEVDAELSPTDAVIKSGVQLGVIAQELQEVCPDCVEQQSTGVLSVQTDEIFWHMVNAIKELKAINDAQAVRIETLETKVTALEAQLATPPATPSAEPNA